MIRRPPRSTRKESSAASDVYKRQNLDFFDAAGEVRIPDAYERLLLEVFKGDQWLFVSREEIEASWHWCDSLIAAWTAEELKVHRYSAGSSGPAKAEMLIERDDRSWFGE